MLGRELSLRAVSMCGMKVVSHQKHRSSKHTAVHMCTGAPIARNARQETETRVGRSRRLHVAHTSIIKQSIRVGQAWTDGHGFLI